MLTQFGSTGDGPAAELMPPNQVEQSNPVAIMFSSGTTGRVKGVLMTHQNLIAPIAGIYHMRLEQAEPELPLVSLFTLPLFHMFGFYMLLRAFAFGETVVLMEKFDFVFMLRAIERYRVTRMPVSPPLIMAFVKSEIAGKYDLSSLRSLGCGGAPLGKEVAIRFRERFPHVELTQSRPASAPFACLRYGPRRSIAASGALLDPVSHGVQASSTLKICATI